jgi:hypothetical protein
VSIEQHWAAHDVPGWDFSTRERAPYRAGARRYDAGGITDAMRLAKAETALQQLLAWGVEWISQQLCERVDAAIDGMGEGVDHDWRIARPHAHILGLRPHKPVAASVAAAVAEQGIILTERLGVLRIAPHLHLSVEQMRKAGASIARALATTRGA